MLSLIIGTIFVGLFTYGEELRKWHNHEYDYEGNGVVNPAILSIG